MDSFPSVLSGQLKLIAGPLVPERAGREQMYDLDGRCAVHFCGTAALAGFASQIIGIEAKNITSSGPGILRSKYSGIDTWPGQVTGFALHAFLKVSSSGSLERFVKKSGLLGLYPTLVFWSAPGTKGRFAGEPVDSCLWHVDRLRTLDTLLKIEKNALSSRSLKTKVAKILDGTARRCSGRTTYLPIHETNDLGEEDPLLACLKEPSERGCKEFAWKVIEHVLRQTLVPAELAHGRLMLASNCLLGFLYLQLARRHELLTQPAMQETHFCRMCNALVTRGRRGPAPLFCRQCLNARRNYPHSEAALRRRAAMAERERAFHHSPVQELVNRYYEVYSEDEAGKRLISVLESGLPRRDG